MAMWLAIYLWSRLWQRTGSAVQRVRNPSARSLWMKSQVASRDALPGGFVGLRLTLIEGLPLILH
jgi:hypothetical protein